MSDKITYTVQMSIVGSDGTVLPLSVLDKHRLLSNPNQIGRRYWDETWRDWAYELLTIESGIDVTGFIDENGG